ncbi:transposase [Streptomyces sp. NBRC 110611]|uniref:transposase n=1 Tax=Streptomyces sp. NBRC 110611 TaxID=1621259 RepID=UPI0015EE6E2C
MLDKLTGDVERGTTRDQARLLERSVVRREHHRNDQPPFHVQDTNLTVHASFHVLAVVITAGQQGDAPVFEQVTDRIRVPQPGAGRPRPRLERVLADRAAYSSRRIHANLRRHGIAHTIPEECDQAGTGSGGAPPAAARPDSTAKMYKRRHEVECRIGLFKQARGVATRYDKLASAMSTIT